MSTTDRTISLLDQLLESITPYDQNRTDNRMLLAARIADVMAENGITQKALAEKLNKKHSVISLWLSGTHNFTCDTLSDIEIALETKLFQYTEPQPIINLYFTVVSQKVSDEHIEAEHRADDNCATLSESTFEYKAHSPNRQKNL